MKLTDLYAVNDTFASGLGRVDILSGGFVRFVLYVERRNELDGTTDNVIIDQIIMPLSGAMESVGMAAAALAKREPDAIKELMAGVH